jgi:hypothetical protein
VGTKTNLIEKFLFTGLEGSWAKVLPDEGTLFAREESGNIACSFYLGPQHTLGVFGGDMLDDRIEGFGADLISKHSHVSVGLRSQVSGY